MILIVILCVFMMGAIVGSFVNVVIERTIRGEDWVKGRSRCDSCHKQIAWYDNIPLLSYMLLRRRCRYCKKRISIQHPAVELMTGVLFVWWYVIGFAFFQLTSRPLQFIQPLFWLMVGIFLLIIFVTDYRYMIIPDYAVAGLGLTALLYRVYLTQSGVMRINDLWLALLSGVVASLFFFCLWAGTKGRGMGFGDVKYVLVMGWLLGWPRVVVGIFMAFCIGAIVGVGLLVQGKKTLKQHVPFGPFLVVSTLLALVWGNQIWTWYFGLLK